ncbi:MAG: hypothetical protein ACLSAC_11810 [Enterocloster bolteae]
MNEIYREYPIIESVRFINCRNRTLDVRESLEDQTMNMARAVKELFEADTVRYSNGQTVQTVLAGRYHRTCCRSSSLRT